MPGFPTEYALYAQQVKRAGNALMALGCEPGCTVAILVFNRPEWVIVDLASMAIGGAPAGVYTTSSPSELRYVVPPRRVARHRGREQRSSRR